ncbi:putative baseplate assembly protein [Cohnella zeiphila]|uniref:Putative baseplate assembly protein n=1 Tax=Cohnella zeiphila TaxID=2761120 RepID=A0A7X0ST24_9BACL|nr:putative baseplate assembly protein [Cohnella zeiphila]MBB6735597.1 putative baseplate assembly protein [Cohnella zeiphila]
MLPRLSLDDRTYENILEDARRGIPKRMPEWTDENAHDPGMTMLELFAWMTEMQQFYLSRIPDANRRKFLDLLGFAPKEAASARAEASFGAIAAPVALPRGTKLKAKGETFETEEQVRLVPLSIERVVTRTEREASDMTASNAQGDVSYYAFGREAGRGSRLYIALDREPLLGQLVTLSVQLVNSDNLFGDRVVPSAKVSWKAYGLDEKTQQPGWLPLETYEDATVHLTYSGRITFFFESQLLPVIVHPANDRPRYWICCTLEEPGYEFPPRIDRLLLNTAMAEHRDTKSETLDFNGPGLSRWRLEADSYLGRYGDLRVQVREEDGRWREWRQVAGFDGAGPEDRCFTVETRADGARAVRFGDGVRGLAPPAGKGNVRRIHSDKTFGGQRWLGRSNGLPNQRFELFDLAVRRREELRLQVGEPGEKPGEWLWEDWLPVESFDRSGPLDRHFVYDREKGEIRFGNDENGAIPSVCAEPNICITVCVLGGGERGNIQPHLLTHWVLPEQRALGLAVTNAGYGSGGEEAESLSDCVERLQLELKRPFRAVTDEDYASIAKETPGLKVARVHVIPAYAPGRSAPSPGAVTVVVVPDNDQKTPMPSEGYLRTIAGHLDDRRLVTTEVHVIAPEYVEVTVHATVIVEPYFTEENERIVKALANMLRPLGGENGGWPFGRTVHRGDVYSAISRVNGVAYVQELWLEAAGRYARKSASGDVLLPPNGLVYSGGHRVELISRTQV